MRTLSGFGLLQPNIVNGVVQGECRSEGVTYLERISWMARIIDGGSIVTISLCGNAVGGKSVVVDLWWKKNN